MGEAGEASDIGHGIVCLGPSAERRTADIDGVSAMDDRFDPELGILGGSQQFDLFSVQGHVGARASNARIVYRTHVKAGGHGDYAGPCGKGSFLDPGCQPLRTASVTRTMGETLKYFDRRTKWVA